MLGIVASYHQMQFHGKLVIQIQENGATNFFFFIKIWLRQSLDIIVSNNHVQYQKALMIQS